ncbi:MAG: cytochrome c [Spirochaetota bacterium]
MLRKIIDTLIFKTFKKNSLSSLSILAALAFAVLVFLAGKTSSIYAADIKAGEAKSAMCYTCHGIKGISTAPTYPNLAGQKKKYLIQQLKNYRSGFRKNAIMSAISQALSDKDIANLAAYYASLK